MAIQVLTVLFWLLVSHAVCDYPLQGDFLAKAKNHCAPLPGVPWWIALAAHSLIHAGGVALVTNSVTLGIGEFLCHFWIDVCKSQGWFGLKIDQALHVACKVGWVLAMWGASSLAIGVVVR
jgi:hypothetical protein